MARTIDRTTIAILYETVTGHCRKRGVLTTTSEIIDVDAELARNPLFGAVIVQRSLLPGGSANEAFFRQQVALATGTAVSSAADDRAVMVDAAGAVISVHYGNVPGLDKPHPGCQLISHTVADVMDTWNGTVFLRPYAAVNVTTGLVVKTYLQDCTLPIPIPPNANIEHILIGTHTVGQTIPVKPLA